MAIIAIMNVILGTVLNVRNWFLRSANAVTNLFMSSSVQKKPDVKRFVKNNWIAGMNVGRDVIGIILVI